MSDDHEFIRDYLALQHKGVPLLPSEHDRLLQLLDAGFVGMDGFKYCWPEVAKENRRKMLEAYPWARTA